MPAEKEDLQLATVGTTTRMLSMPAEEFTDLIMSPLQDDTWIRTEQIVHMEGLVDTEGGEQVKREILREYMEGKSRDGSSRMDPILEGMMYQETLMQDYRKGPHAKDKAKATTYRQRLMEEHRRARAVKGPVE